MITVLTIRTCEKMRDFTKKYFHLNSSAVYNSCAKKYCRLLPSGKSSQKFYLHSRPKFTATTWYFDHPYRNHKIADTIRDMCTKTGVKGKFKYTPDVIKPHASETITGEKSENEDRICKEVVKNESVDDDLADSMKQHLKEFLNAYKMTKNVVKLSCNCR